MLPMQLFLRSLPEDCYFNIVGFGSSYVKLFPASVAYSEASLTAATSDITRLVADLGGTEILEPLQNVLQAAPQQGYARQVFVLTDGEVSNNDAIIAAVAGQQISRVFGLGLGHGASHALIEGIAKAGRGTAVFVTEDSVLQRMVIQQLTESLQPALTNVKLEWHASVLPAPPLSVDPHSHQAMVEAQLALSGLMVPLHPHPLTRIECAYANGWCCDRCGITGKRSVLLQQLCVIFASIIQRMRCPMQMGLDTEQTWLRMRGG